MEMARSRSVLRSSYCSACPRSAIACGDREVSVIRIGDRDAHDPVGKAHLFLAQLVERGADAGDASCSGGVGNLPRNSIELDHVARQNVDFVLQESAERLL